METVLRAAQEIINPTRENADAKNTSSTTVAPGDSTGIISLIKKNVIREGEDTKDAGAISPPESGTTSPALMPVGTASKAALSFPAPISTSTTGLKPISPPMSHPSSPTSPIRSISPPSPPPHSRQFVSTSPPTRISSASSSQIFERNVQESHSLPLPPSTTASPPTASKIPAHIATENHIPAVLEASSIAITDGNIDPENVEIAMLTTHQPLASQVSQHGHKEKEKDKVTLVEQEDFLPPSTSHSGHSLGPSYTQDKRRLSFISFSDIVQAEQADLLDSTMLSPSPLQTMNSGFPAQPMVDQAGLSGITETLVRRRSPSPMRRGQGALPGSPPGLVQTFCPSGVEMWRRALWWRPWDKP
ncbi:hypothetical protein BGX38DRAFT_1142673 [Terfezia claveryi]|nr:hypothetical protein BGX38DRAFT_1142673 [Terfezia claveryi]